MEKLKFMVECDEPITVKTFLTDKKGLSKRQLTRLKRINMGITCNGEHIRTVDTVKKGDVLVLLMQDERFLEGNGALNVPIAYESEAAVIFDKPAGMPVHPSIKHQGDTLGNYFAYLYPGLTFRPVNRLDRDTSGLCAVAKNAHSAYMMKPDKTYFAVVCGVIEENGIIDQPVARAEESIILRCVSSLGRRAVTHYKVLKSNGRYTLLEIELETGRTHQIRVHFAYIGHPLAGDEMYGGLTEDIEGQALHCGRLKFYDIFYEKYIEIYSNMRKDIVKLI